jgi:hypothetical protein
MGRPRMEHSAIGFYKKELDHGFHGSTRIKTNLKFLSVFIRVDPWSIDLSSGHS